MNIQKNSVRLMIALLVLNLIASLCMGGYLLSDRDALPETGVLSAQLETGEKYILYIRTNDKDTYTQLIPTDKAREIVNGICARYTDGYTASDARGGWVDETGTLAQEQTLVYEFYQISEEQLTRIMDEILSALNQNTILVERRQAAYTYYAGSGT